MMNFVPMPGSLLDQVSEVLRYYHYACSTEIRTILDIRNWH